MIIIFSESNENKTGTNNLFYFAAYSPVSKSVIALNTEIISNWGTMMLILNNKYLIFILATSNQKIKRINSFG